MEVKMANETEATRGYLYVEMKIFDPLRFREYTALSAPAVRAAGGRYIVLGARPEVLEGTSDADRVVLVEFPTPKDAKEFYYSAAYQAARTKREGAAEFKMLLMEGRA
jgi:uncharacterized protein (DUF1330 family)